MEKENDKKKTIIGFDYFPNAKSKDILDMNVEKTLEYILHITRKEKYQDIDSLREHLKNILKWLHQTNMEAIDRGVNDHIEVCKASEILIE